ncbi:MAG: 30S ribosomal protein S12 methylthiotransferase RimO [Planctomycetes bacterium]|nr:30S ribosomal protein S12 methylthiotransferase RimO [Planctomycetota bacterium]
MPKLFLASLGCAKNLVDAETMLGETLDDEFHLAVDPGDADVIIINTCGFIEEARQEAREVIGEYLALKRQSGGRVRVVATGCWAERSPEALRREFPDLDAAWGLGTPSSLRDALRRLEESGDPHRPDDPAAVAPPAPPILREGARLVSTLPSFAYLRLSDGCDNRCHYCAIPLIRGGLRSRSPEAIVDEARLLEEQGARELVIIGQDTTAYAADRRQPGLSLATLLENLLQAVSVPRLRLLYAHPAHLEDRVMDLLRQEERLCGYLDLPIQHISEGVLRRMGRGYGRERVEEILDRLQGLTLRTTILTGFPGETEEEFTELLDWVAAGRCQHLGAFAYSPEEGTAAFGFPDGVPAAEAARRRAAILEAQRRHAFAWLDARVGGTETVVVDSRLDRDWVVARSRHEAPDADGRIYLQDRKTRPGRILQACIIGREGYDLTAAGATSGHRRKKRAK